MPNLLQWRKYHSMIPYHVYTTVWYPCRSTVTYVLFSCSNCPSQICHIYSNSKPVICTVGKFIPLPLFPQPSYPFDSFSLHLLSSLPSCRLVSISILWVDQSCLCLTSNLVKFWLMQYVSLSTSKHTQSGRHIIYKIKQYCSFSVQEN